MDPPTVFWTPQIQDVSENPHFHHNYQWGTMACSNTYASTPWLFASWKILKHHHPWWAWDSRWTEEEKKKVSLQSFPAQAVWAASPHDVTNRKILES